MIRPSPLSALVWSVAIGCATSPTPAAPPTPADATSEACVGCHPSESAAWSRSHHALAEQPTRAVSGAFADPNAPALDLPAADGVAARPIARVIGVAPLWQPMVAGQGGRLQVSNLAYDPARQDWFDVFPDARSPGDWGHWTGGGMVWNSQCAHCHDTGVNRGWDGDRGTYATTFAELGVGCAACHGDATAHVQDPTSAPTGPKDREAMQASCERCHTRGVPLVDDPPAGAPLLDVILPAMPGADRTWWPDGQIRDEAFEGAVFRTSLMHDKGVRCVDCHDAHTGQTRRAGDALCMDCHAANPRLAGHTHHDGLPGAPSCVDCHMPTTVYMQRHPRHDHGFRIPDPALSKELGSPDACAACHTDPRVSIAAAARWWTPRAHERDRARAIAAAQSEAPTAPAMLQGALRAETHPFWRSVLIAAGASPAPSTAGAPLDPWTRLARASTAAGLDRLPTDRSASDPLAVRLATARAALADLPADPRADDELRRWLDAHTDFGGVALTLGTWHAVRGQATEAIAAYAQATRLDPGSAEAWHGLAVTQAAAGRTTDAVDTLDHAVARLPQDPELHFSRGLALAGAGRLADAIDAFQRTLALAPTHPRAAYNAGLALHQRGDHVAARRMLTVAMHNAPRDPAPAYALATVLFAGGDARGARRAARAALAIQPDHADAAALLLRLDTPP